MCNYIIYVNIIFKVVIQSTIPDIIYIYISGLINK